MAAAVLTGCGGSSAPSGAPSTEAALHDRLLAMNDLPAGWSAVTRRTLGSVQTSTPCLSEPDGQPEGMDWVRGRGLRAGHHDPYAVPKVLATGPQARQRWQSLAQAMARCQTATLTIGGHQGQGHHPAPALPADRPARPPPTHGGSRSAGIQIGFDLLLFETRDLCGLSHLLRPGTAHGGDGAGFRGRGGSEGQRPGRRLTVPDEVSITSAPIRTARTTLGTVAYRTVGSGPPLVMITGLQRNHGRAGTGASSTPSPSTTRS